MNRLKLSWLCLACLTLLFSACNKDDEQDPVGVEITVSNAGSPVGGATVTLYLSGADWTNEQNAVVTGTTDASGKVRFLDQTGTFYVDVVSGAMSNWKAGASASLITATDGTLSSAAVTVETTFQHLISSGAGITFGLPAGHPLQACNDDDLDTFFKGGAFTDDNGSESCGDPSALDTNASWGLNADETVFTLSGANYPEGGLSLAVLSITADQIDLALDLGGGASLPITLVKK